MPLFPPQRALRSINSLPWCLSGRPFCTGDTSTTGSGSSSNSSRTPSHQHTPAVPLYRLVYFNTRGAAELTRYLLAITSVPYDDVRYPMQARGAGFGVSPEFLRDQQAGAFAVNRDQLPVLQVLSPDGKTAVATLGQSHAINRFLAARHGLLGSDDTLIVRAQIDAIYESVRDIRSEFLRIKRQPHHEARKDWIRNILPAHCQSLEASLPPSRPRHNSPEATDSPFLFGGDTPTLADVAVVSLLGTAQSPLTGTLVTAFDDYDPTPAYENHKCPRLRASVEALQVLLKPWYAKRPDTFS